MGFHHKPWSYFPRNQLSFSSWWRAQALLPNMTYVKVVESICQLSTSSTLVLRGVIWCGGLGCIRNACDGLLQLLVYQVPVSFVGCNIRVLQAGLGCSVEDWNILLQDSSSCSHLITMAYIFQFLKEENEKLEGFYKGVNSYQDISTLP